MKQSWLIRQLSMALFSLLPSMYAVSYAAEKAAQFTPRVYGGNWVGGAPAVINLGTARQYHTTTLMNNGILFTVGGYSTVGVNLVPLDTSERYNPGTNLMVAGAVPPLVTARAEHTATLLPNTAACGGVVMPGVDGLVSRVLVVGGRDINNDAIRTAELYNPATNTWLAGDAGMMMATARSSHTATLLPGGGCRVLITGGNANDYSPMSGAEIYTFTLDPITGTPVHTWTSAGNMANARSNHTATILPSSGQVLVTGGANDAEGALRSAEIYNPVTGLWSMTGSMHVARIAHTATQFTNNASTMVLVAGGYNANNAGLNTAEVYNPANGLWSMVRNLIGVGRSEHTATLLHNGEILVAGGSPGNNIALNTSQIYNPVEDAWRNVDGIMGGDVMFGARYAHTATLVDLLQTPRILSVNANTTYNNNAGGMVYLLGGSSGGIDTLITATRYTPTAITLQATIPAATTTGTPIIPVPNGLNNTTFNGRVNTTNADDTTAASFEYGLTTGYGSTIPAAPTFVPPAAPDMTPLAGDTNNLVIPATANTTVGGLLCNRIYNYRVRATDNGTGNIVVGGNRTVTTAACNRTDVTVTMNNFSQSFVGTPPVDVHGIPPIIAANAGNSVAYMVTVANRGPSNEPITRVVLRMPAVPFLTVNAIFSCDADPLAPGLQQQNVGTNTSCPPVPVRTVPLLQGTGLIIPSLGRNGSVTFDIHARLALNTPTMNLTYSALLTIPPNRFVDIAPSNNIARDTDQIFDIGNLPDLRVTGITLAPASPAANTGFSATVTVKNFGTGATGAGGFVVDVWPNQPTDRVCRTTNTANDLSAAIARSVASGASTQVTIANIPAGTAGAKIFRAFVDGTCRINNETDETNNQLTKSYTVK